MSYNSIRTPGVYIDEVDAFSASVAGVATGIPAFVGYTELAMTPAGKNLHMVPTRITSLLEYESLFGKAKAESTADAITITIDEVVDKLGAGGKTQSRAVRAEIDESKRSKFNLYYSIYWYFVNGGGPCYIVSVGQYGVLIPPPPTAPSKPKIIDGIKALELEDEPTLIVIPEATNFALPDYAEIYESALSQAASLGDRFVIMDVLQKEANPRDDIDTFRDNFEENRKFGAAYFPYIKTSLDFFYDDAAINVVDNKNDKLGAPATPDRTWTDVKSDALLFEQAKAAISQIELILPPSPAIAAVYAKTDADRGVWKAPANVGLNSTIGPTVKIDNDFQDNMNIPGDGKKAVNAVRYFTGRGTVVWGARTLMSESNDWRYINVRRFFNFVEESVKKATYTYVFEPNDANTWISVRAMIENFLTLQWRDGALQGAKPEQAFYVRVGLGQTMSVDDINNGRMIVEIGMAVVRPAEFIILRFTQKAPEA